MARIFLVYLDENERNAKDEALNFFDVNIYVRSERLDRSERESKKESERDSERRKEVINTTTTHRHLTLTLSLSHFLSPRSFSPLVYLLTSTERMFAHHTLYVFLQLRSNNPQLNRSICSGFDQR